MDGSHLKSPLALEQKNLDIWEGPERRTQSQSRREEQWCLGNPLSKCLFTQHIQL